MQAEGNAQHNKGEAEYKTAQAQGYVEGLVDQGKGIVNNVVGAMTGNTSKQAEGATCSIVQVGCN